MTEKEILALLNEIVDKRTNNKLIDIVVVEDVVKTDDLLKIKILIEGISSSDKQVYRKLIEDQFDKKGIDVLITIVTEKSKPTTSSEQPISHVKPFLPEEVTKKFKKTVAVYSTKGGVGKSTVSCELALELSERGFKVAIIDLDIYGPSVPRILGYKDKVQIQDKKFIPAKIKGIHMMSVGLLISSIDSPLIWRAPIVNGVISQIFVDTLWDNEYDVLILDMPPGTGDIPILAAQSLSLSGVLAISTPQGIALEDTIKGVSMLQKFNIPVIGLAFNMGAVVCSDCQKTIPIYPRNADFDKLLSDYKVSIVANLPLDPKVTELADQGLLSDIDKKSMWYKEFDKIVDTVVDKCVKNNELIL